MGMPPDWQEENSASAKKKFLFVKHLISIVFYPMKIAFCILL